MNNQKILLLDIETFPNKGYTWGKWQQDVIEFVDHWYILSFAWNWLGEKKINCRALCDLPNYKPGIKDEDLLPDLWALLDEADIIVAQNGDAFDVPKINTRLLQHGYTPPSPFRTVDTLKIARKFSLNSNKLDDQGRDLGIGRKTKHVGFPLWLGCAEGDTRSWAVMKRYNKNDVKLLKKLYYKYLPWTEGHPPVSKGADKCPRCGGTTMVVDKLYQNKTTGYQQYRCKSCGGWCRGTTNKLKFKPLVAVA